MKKLIIIFLIIFLLIFLIPKSIGNDNPLNGLVYPCFGLTYKSKEIHKYNNYSYNAYKCIGIPFDYGSKCFKILFGHCKFGM